MKYLSFLVLCLISCASPSREPANLSDLKREVTTYAESGDYQGDVAASVASAEAFLTRRAASGQAKLAVIFDIDETVLSNLPHMKETDWGYQPPVWSKWVARAEAPAIEPVKKVYQTAVDLDLAVIFLTGRTEDERAATAKNLTSQGMGKYEKLVLRPNKSDAPYEKAVAFKSRVRKNLTSEGYTIIASFGDQTSDLEGGYSERNFKIPNPFYKIP
ncbi:HAD family acid phosphatase [Roseibacillus persicicus]|uniref:Acid phosphatase n=1 Tax=Roseibacillus persicicus TaxID=454148 RepID=A0A918WN14_9BACT|nr:HAD family acid phosphatase [Roseibacillus persicicus]GHC61181.1 acid phosphatase [Roseibacillus persicicus]